MPMHPIAQIAAEGIVSCLVLGMLVATIAWLMTRMLPAASARLRFVVWFSALGTIGLVPVVQNLVHFGAERVSVGTESGLLVLPLHWAWYLFGAWVLVAGFGVMRVVLGAWHLWKLRSESRVVPVDELNPVVRASLQRALRQRNFEVRVSAAAHVPMAIGFFRPAVVFPADLLHELSAEQLNQVVLHESTHLLRYDDWTNLLQKLLRAVLFFHPAVWWLENKLTLEREIACDEAVVAETHDARSYAECLATLAEKSVLRRSLALVQAAVSRLRHTSLRVEQVLAMEKRTSTRGWGAAVSVVGVISCAAVLVQSPDLVTFQNKIAAPSGSFSAETDRASGSEAKVVQASLTSETPHAAPAMMKSAAAPQPVKLAVKVKTATESAAQSYHSEPDQKQAPRVLLAKQHSGQVGTPIPILVTTMMVVESAQSGASNQVWVVRTWRMALYYPQPEQTKQIPPRKI